MFIPDPDFYPFRIPDPVSRILDPTTKEGGGKQIRWHKFHKIVIYVCFEQVEKKNLSQLKKKYSFVVFA
jgi:hypothetical protein